eukprot:10533564-Karenia_brevis.AAC.1
MQFVHPNDEMFKLEKRAINMICGVPPQTFNKHDRFDLGALGLSNFRSLFAVSVSAKIRVFDAFGRTIRECIERLRMA